jgi:scyllo-inositol 2-dehydrogenase (NADP+)
MTLRVGLVGYGLAGRFFHAPLLKDCGFNVVGIVTQNPQRISEAISDFPNTTILPSVEEVLKFELDLLVVASANVVHARDAVAGLRAGVPVVVDKPMARSVEETQEILTVAERCDTPVTTYFNRLFDSDTLTIREALRERTLGEVFRFDSRFEKFRPEVNPSSWRENSSALDGGGNLLDLGPHLVSTALSLFGPAELMYASVRSIRGAADDDVFLVLRHEAGVDSYLSASSILGSFGPRIRLSGTLGSLVIDELDPQEAQLRQGKMPRNGLWDPPATSTATIHRGISLSNFPSKAGNYSQFYKLVENAIAGTGPWPVSQADILAVAQILEKAREISVR